VGCACLGVRRLAQLTSGAAVVGFSVLDPATGTGGEGIARVDSGADRSLIDTGLIASAGLAPSGTLTIVGIDGQPQDLPVYVLDLDLGTHGVVKGVQFVGDNLQKILGYDALIGVDVLKTGLFVYQGYANTFELQAGMVGYATPAVPTWPLYVGLGLVIAGGVGIVAALARSTAPQALTRVPPPSPDQGRA